VLLTIRFYNGLQSQASLDGGLEAVEISRYLRAGLCSLASRRWRWGDL